MYTNTESLQEVHELIKEALETAGSCSSSISPTSYAHDVASRFRTAIDQRRAQLSEALYKVDLAMKGYDDGAMQTMYEMQDLYGNTQSKTISDQELTDRFVQQTAHGYRVYDSRYGMWIDFSAASEIHIEMMISPDLGGTPIARIRAYDPESNTNLEYEDWEITQQDIRKSYLADATGIPDDWREIKYQDDLYGMAVTGNGGINAVTGAIEAGMWANYYRASDNLFGGNFSNFYKGWQGDWAPIRGVQGLDAGRNFGQWTQDIGELSAKTKGSKAANLYKWGGVITFVLSVGFSANNIKKARDSNDSNYDDVLFKNSLDIVFACTTFIPGIGWVISGTYFLLDAGGVFGNWGQASGFSRETVDGWIARDHAMAQEELCTMDFEIDYVKPIEQVRMEMMRESREFTRDKTYVIPRAIYSTKRF